MSVQRHRTAGRSCDAGSYPYVYIGSTEVQHSNDNRVSEREERNTDTQRNSWGEARVTNKNFWTRGYCVTTVGLNEQQIRKYIQNQEKLDSGEEGQLYLEGVEIK
ncbi:hypothetical protein FACS1894106_4550 [Spirochaetia bacterium]|nr:hypothetical protein FACS1894106_4550 [Spirochaetia bacterium]